MNLKLFKAFQIGRRRWGKSAANKFHSQKPCVKVLWEQICRFVMIIICPCYHSAPSPPTLMLEMKSGEIAKKISAALNPLNPPLKSSPIPRDYHRAEFIQLA